MIDEGLKPESLKWTLLTITLREETNRYRRLLTLKLKSDSRLEWRQRCYQRTDLCKVNMIWPASFKSVSITFTNTTANFNAITRKRRYPLTHPNTNVQCAKVNTNRASQEKDAYFIAQELKKYREGPLTTSGRPWLTAGSHVNGVWQVSDAKKTTKMDEAKY